ncbi:GH14160 [Drosophila grimshawi]|uniref:Polypeptide N-acetylgalactosaminyltransferase n=1 Tax=Drosophila grimshawi TaxID=7222 RepID=B4JXS5_DROGR|nr:GH14160 [Drosophila grimshawi]
MICIILQSDLQLFFHQEQLNLCNKFIERTPDRPDSFFQYNRQLSDKINAVRELPITRHESCNTRRYSLPHYSRAKLSVVISFYNEARSMLLRTILTLINRTSEDYLHELIIIDDCSEDVGLLDNLKQLMRNLFTTKSRLTLILKRNQHRKGLIWSRNEGVRVASGNYLLFLDSHCEVNKGWLEPLLERLALNSSLAVSPLLDPIEPETFSYRTGNVLLKGGFDWSLHFHWLPRVLAELESPEMQYTSPAFAGGILMISREWFLKLRGFNPELQIWGGESIELAIKLWLCGGQIEIVPCSRIGHLFRPRHAFEFPPQFDQKLDSAQATYLRNSKIIAESWLDEYKYLFYALKPAAKQIPLNIHEAQLYDPILIKDGHQCHRFDWYLRHVSPELKLQHWSFSALGTLRNKGRCLHVESTFPKLELLLTSCFRLKVSQWHLHPETGQLSTESKRCLGVRNMKSPERPQLMLEPCVTGQVPSQRWQRRDTQLLHAETHLCLDNPLKNQLELSSCRPHAASQSFQFALEVGAQA